MEQIIHIDDIIQEEGMDVMDWMSEVFKQHSSKGNEFILYISNSRIKELLLDLSWCRDLDYYKIWLELTNITIKKTNEKERLEIIK